MNYHKMLEFEWNCIDSVAPSGKLDILVLWSLSSVFAFYYVDFCLYDFLL